MPRRHRRTHRAHESSSETPSLDQLLHSLRDTDNHLFELTSHISERLAHLGDTVNELACLVAAHMPEEFKERVGKILSRQLEFDRGKEQQATEVLDSITPEDIARAQAEPTDETAPL